MTIELFLIFYYLILQVKFQPFTSAKLNNLEQFSLIASVLSLFAGFLFNYPISDWLKETITFFIIFINLCFIMNFFLSILRIWLSSSHSKLKKFCPCVIRASIIVWKSYKIWNNLNLSFILALYPSITNMNNRMKSNIQKLSHFSRNIWNGQPHKKRQKQSYKGKLSQFSDVSSHKIWDAIKVIVAFYKLE